MNIQLKKFDVSTIDPFSLIYIISKRGQGKSTIIKDIMYYKRDIPVGTVISPTEPSNQFYQKFVPKMFIHNEYQSNIITNLLKRQKKMKKRINNKEDIDGRAYLILDDLMYDNSWKKDKCMKEVIYNSRHMLLDTIISLQDPIGVNPGFRFNCDYCFLLKENKMINRKKLYDNYASMFPTFEVFSSTLEQCTQNYECLVINNKANGGKLEDQVFWYKADMHNDFHVGPEEIWRYSEQNYIDEDDDDDEININTYSTKKMPKVNVKKISSY